MPATKMDHETLTAIADKAEAVFAVGNTDPHASEIHAALAADDDAPDVSAGAVLGAMCDVKAMLEERGFDLTLVADPYYEKYDRSLPETDAQVRDCLPMGPGKQGVGLRLWQKDDRIAEVWEDELLKRAAGMMSANVGRCVKAVEDGRMDQGKAVRMLQRWFSRAGEVDDDGRKIPRAIQRNLLGDGADA